MFAAEIYNLAYNFATTLYFFLFNLILYIQVNKFSDMLELVFLDSTSTKQGLMCWSRTQCSDAGEAQPATPLSRVKHSTTELRCSLP